MTGPVKGERRLPIDITTTRDAASGQIPALAAYAFSSGGALLDMQQLDEKGNTRLSLPVDKEGDTVRVVLGPLLDKGEVSAGELLRRGGIDQHLPLRPNIEQLPPLRYELSPDILRPWLGRLCVVKGTLIKRVVSGGYVRELPVCNAAVDIYEVDPWTWIIPRLPQLELDRLRDILDGPWPPIRLPIPPRPPEFILPDLGPDLGGAVSLNPQPLPPRAGVRTAMSMTRSGFELRDDRPKLTLALPAELQLTTRAARPAFERAVLGNVELLRPILCWLYPRFVTRTKIATAMTDECGHFRTIIWRSIFNADVPDLYFSARQRIWPFFWTTIYEPTPIGCHTYWDYQCGTEVKLVTTHPLAHTCPPCPPIDAPPNWVLFMAIGNTSTWRIHGANTDTRVGGPLHDSNLFGLVDNASPWGGTLRPRLEFDNSLRGSLGVKYYRVAYKRPSESDAEWRFSNDAVNRHYIQTIAGEPVISQYPLGPNSVGAEPHLYEIPPALPPAGQWSLPNVVLDTQSAVIPTAAVAQGVPYDENGAQTGPDQGGLWQIRIELFDTVGNIVDPAVLNIKWRVPMSNDLTGTIPTADAAALGLVNAAAKAMIVTVRVDNNPCFASIAAPTVNGTPASSACGVMNYASLAHTVVTPFVALQRSRFAKYDFYVQRGEGPGAQLSVPTSVAPASVAGMPAPPSTTVGDLLDGCSIAGFTEQLYVAHQGTDGWSRQSGLDASAVRAFVLSPVLALSPP